MEIDIFISDFATLFDETNPTLFTPDTRIRSIEEWSSLIALGVIAMVDAKYNVQINGKDLRDCTTIQDIFDIVKSRK